MQTAWLFTNYSHALAFCAARGQQSGNGSIQGRQPSTVVDGQPEQVGVADLTVPYDSVPDRLHCPRKTNLISPEPVAPRLLSAPHLHLRPVLDGIVRVRDDLLAHGKR